MTDPVVLPAEEPNNLSSSGEQSNQTQEGGKQPTTPSNETIQSTKEDTPSNSLKPKEAPPKLSPVLAKNEDKIIVTWSPGYTEIVIDITTS